MGLLEPQHILLLMLFFHVIFPIWGYREGAKRTIGATNGLLLGLFLSWIGIIIVYCANPIDTPLPFYYDKNPSTADELKKYKELLDNGAITQEEYDTLKAKILNS